MVEFLVICGAIVSGWLARGWYDRQDWSGWTAELDDEPVDNGGRTFEEGDPRGY